MFKIIYQFIHGGNINYRRGIQAIDSTQNDLIMLLHAKYDDIYFGDTDLNDPFFLSVDHAICKLDKLTRKFEAIEDHSITDFSTLKEKLDSLRKNAFEAFDQPQKHSLLKQLELNLA